MVRNVNPDESTRTVSVPQHFTQTCLSGLDDQITHAEADKPSAILLDLSTLQAVDGASLNWLLQTQTRLATTGIELRLFNPSEVCHDVLLATRLDSRFTIATANEPTLEAAGVQRHG